MLQFVTKYNQNYKKNIFISQKLTFPENIDRKQLSTVRY